MEDRARINNFSDAVKQREGVQNFFKEKEHKDAAIDTSLLITSIIHLSYTVSNCTHQKISWILLEY